MSIRKTIFLLVSVTVFASCAKTYNIQGSSSITALDGSKLYLKTLQHEGMKAIDSCDVVHGKFHFTGLLDTICMANLFMDEEAIMPIVLEEGDITIRIDNAMQRVSGTPMNDSLYKFIDQHNQISSRMTELSHQQSQMLLEGIDEDEIDRKLNKEASRIAAEEDRLVTSFIVNNFGNVLGTGVFMMVTSQYRYPVLTPQIEDIMSKATDKFKNDTYVRDYYQTAQENEAHMNGMDDVAQPLPETAKPQHAAPLTNIPQQ
jgi:hypothetical protein